MRKIELIYDNDCPNVEPARRALRDALSTLGLPLDWKEWDRADPQSPSSSDPCDVKTTTMYSCRPVGRWVVTCTLPRHGSGAWYGRLDLAYPKQFFPISAADCISAAPWWPAIRALSDKPERACEGW